MSDFTPLVVRQAAPPPLTGFVRGLSLFDCVTVVASAMVGSGIFIAPAAMRKADCDGAASYGNKVLAVAPDDAEGKKAFADSALKQNRQRMPTALQKSDWHAALSYANRILALEPGEAEAQKAVKDCTLALSRQAVH